MIENIFLLRFWVVGYEFQQTVASYTGWKYDYVTCDWTDCYERLENGEIDMLGGISYTPEGGAVKVSLQELPCNKAGYVRNRIEVSDIGIGMSEEFLPSLFVAFARERNTTAGKVAGTGLGMPIVKKYVDMMGGTIKVESELGRGSKFTVILEHRIADPEYYEQKKELLSDAQVSEMLQGRRVLLAEETITYKSADSKEIIVSYER